jgi:hypothetical protein
MIMIHSSTKVTIVADGHLTDIPLKSVYSGVASLRGFRIELFWLNSITLRSGPQTLAMHTLKLIHQKTRDWVA